MPSFTVSHEIQRAILSLCQAWPWSWTQQQVIHIEADETIVPMVYLALSLRPW